MSVLEVISVVAPEFSTIDPIKVETLTELVKPLVSKKQFGESYEYALALLVSHKMALMGLGSENGSGGIADKLNVSSYSEGSSSVSYSFSHSNNMLSDAELALTIYGVQFITLRKAKILSIHIAGRR